jgi:hypothetical protein
MAPQYWQDLRLGFDATGKAIQLENQGLHPACREGHTDTHGTRQQTVTHIPGRNDA